MTCLKIVVQHRERETSHKYTGLGMRIDHCLFIDQLTKYQLFQPLNGQKVGRQGTKITQQIDVATLLITYYYKKSSNSKLLY